MLKNADYIYNNVIIADEVNTTKMFCKKAQVGVDLSLRGVKRITSAGLILKDKSIVSSYEDVDERCIYREDWCNASDIAHGFVLEKGTYIVLLNEGCDFGPNDTGLIILRSSLNRCGVSIQSAVWDPGYNSINKDTILPMSVRLTVDTDEGIRIEKNARIAQLLVFQNEDTSLYDGQFQGGNLQSKLTKQVEE